MDKQKKKMIIKAKPGKVLVRRNITMGRTPVIFKVGDTVEMGNFKGKCVAFDWNTGEYIFETDDKK